MVDSKQECYFPTLSLEPSEEGLTDQWYVKPNPKMISFLKKRHASHPTFPSPLRPEELQDTPQNCTHGESRVPVWQSSLGITWKIFLRFSKNSNSEWTWDLNLLTALNSNWIWLLNSIQNRNLSGYSFPETVQLRFQWISWFLPSLRTAGEEMPGSAGTSAGSRTSNQGPTKLSKPLPQLTAPTKGPCPKCHRLSQVRCIRSRLTSVWPGTAVG